MFRSAQHDDGKYRHPEPLGEGSVSRKHDAEYLQQLIEKLLKEKKVLLYVCLSVELPTKNSEFLVF